MKYRMWLTALMVCGWSSLLVPGNDLRAAEYTQAFANKTREPGTPAHWSGDSTVNFHDNCPGFDEPIAKRGVRGGFTERCESRLDQKFLNEIPLLTPIYATDNTLTWRHVFDEPLIKRNIVIRTLNDPDCMVTDKQDADQALSARCNANVIADYAVLKYKCASGIYRIGSRIERGIGFAWSFNVFERIFDNDSYWRKRWGVENAFFRHAWIAAKCAGVPENALASLRAIENTTEFRGYPQPGEEQWWWAEQGYEAYYLMGIADRLSPNLIRTEYGYEPDSISTWQRVQPVMAELLKVKNPGNYLDASQEKAARLKHFIAAQTWMKIRREDVSENWLREQVGEFSGDELAQAADEAVAMMAKQNADSYRH
ncbi:MAG: hypothetical protein OXG15_03485 [Gammaproteobacteria bacterium]|nr:hypothetical protein [Gammaproteobacteria bacterium]